MKKYIILMLILNLSCSDSKDGDWDDNINISQKEFQFNSLENTASITTEGGSWWITGISFRDSQSFDIDDIDTSNGNFTINETEFTLERTEGKEISITLFENTTGVERIFNLQLQSGNYFDGITITQSAD